jgi:hypothetical protein
VDQRHGWVHGGPSGRHEQSHSGTSSAQGAPGAARLQSSPAEAREGEGEGDEAVLMRGSPEHGPW